MCPGQWAKFLEKCHLVRYSSILWALPGAHAPGRVHSPHARSVHDSESLSCLKSNMCAGEIRFSSVKYYLCVSHPSSENISQLNLQNSLRMCPDLQKGYSFSLVGSNFQVYRYSKSYQWPKIWKLDKIFEKVLSGEPKLNFSGPAGGSRTRKGAFASCKLII